MEKRKASEIMQVEFICPKCGKHLAWADIALPERLNTRGGDAVTAPEAVVIIAIDGFDLLAGRG